MKLGILKEPDFENRVALLPEGVEILLKKKLEIIVEEGAGERAFATDKDYSDIGARVADRSQVVKESEVILTINPPKDLKDIGLKENQVLLSVVNPFLSKEVVEILKTNGITTFSMDLVPRITRAQAMDVLSSMATIAGYKAVLDAAMALPKFFPMFMSAAGTIKPAKVLILGAGVAGLQAIAVSRKLGAVVEVFDVRSAVKEEVKSLGGKFIEVEGALEDAAAGGYAVEQSEEFKKKQAQAIHDHAIASDVVICTAQIPGREAPLLLRKTTVEQMKHGAVIVDLAASTGGNCELTENGKEIMVNGVKILGKSDYPSDMPSDASKMFGRNLINFISLLKDDQGNLNLNFDDEIVQGTCLTHNGEVIHPRVKEFLNKK
ncbi:MAG: Re/Si-specific NAD(P)(+) transhydrogenase subunit alpha [Bacteroidales bacterium]|nr:Re/Si-specific NAD(P)(+) transhydrogenase subunit alpha [Bacteroidales bacterium]